LHPVEHRTYLSAIGDAAEVPHHCGKLAAALFSGFLTILPTDARSWCGQPAAVSAIEEP